jgi:hypothetical protein
MMTNRFTHPDAVDGFRCRNCRAPWRPRARFCVRCGIPLILGTRQIPIRTRATVRNVLDPRGF